MMKFQDLPIGKRFTIDGNIYEVRAGCDCAHCGLNLHPFCDAGTYACISSTRRDNTNVYFKVVPASKRGGYRANAGRPRKPADQKLQRVQAYITPEQKALLEERAAAMKMPLSHYIGKLIAIL